MMLFHFYQNCMALSPIYVYVYIGRLIRNTIQLPIKRGEKSKLISNCLFSDKAVADNDITMQVQLWTKGN